MAESTSQSLNLADGAGMVIADVSCSRCSYNLRGLHSSGSCPECGAPVDLALHGDLLRYCDPQWVSNLSRGIRYVLWGFLVMGVVGIVIGVIVEFTRNRVLGDLIAPFAVLASIYGVWLLTEPDPSGTDERPGDTARKVVRFALAAGLVGYVLAIIPRVIVLSSGVGMGLRIGRELVNLIVLVGWIALLFHVERLANRAPDRWLAKSSRMTRWGLGVTVPASQILGLCGEVWSPAGSLTDSTGGIIFASVLVVVALGAGAFGFAYLGILFSLNGMLRTQAKLAKEAWADRCKPKNEGAANCGK